jgi:hypothetical protein
MFLKHSYEEKSVLVDSWPLLLQWEVNFHKNRKDDDDDFILHDLSKCFKRELPLRYNYTVLDEAKALIEPKFGIGILDYFIIILIFFYILF